MFGAAVVVDCELDEDEVGGGGDVQGEAEGKVVAADGCGGQCVLWVFRSGGGKVYEDERFGGERAQITVLER